MAEWLIVKAVCIRHKFLLLNYKMQSSNATRRVRQGRKQRHPASLRQPSADKTSFARR